MSDKRGKIKITKNGPYVVTGNVKLSEKIITPKGKGYVFTEGKQYEDKETYSLCRCGKSKNARFWDGSHIESSFNGTETASRGSYHERADIQEGPDLDLLDDGRCAFARFCHREDGNVWDLVDESDDPSLKNEAVIAAYQCPAGRLVARDKDGNEIDPEHDQSITILQDPQKGASAGLFIRGKIPIESSDGYVYELRNRAVLCRCGESSIKPFCDGSHVSCNFRDK